MNDMQMRCFLMVAKHLNFTHAANQLFLSQQAVSKHIAKLEEELDCELFVRSTRETKLTYAGECYRQVFTGFFDAMKEAGKQIEVYDIQQKNTLRLGLLYDIAMPQKEFKILTESAAGEGLDIRIERYEMVDIIQLLISGKLDFIVTYGAILRRATVGARFGSMKIYDFSLVFNFSERYPNADRLHTAEDLDGELFLTYRLHNDLRSISEVRREYSDKLLENGVHSDNIEVMPNMASVDTAVEMGVGIGRCSTLNYSAYKQGVRAIPAPNSAADLVLAWNTENVTPQQQAFIQKIKEKLQ